MLEERGWLDDSWAFTKSLRSGVLDAVAGLVEGLGELIKGGYALATDDKARESAWNTTKKLAKAAEDYGEEVWDDPAKAYRDARDGTLAAYNSFEQAKEKAASEGRSAEFWGNLTGKGIFEVVTILFGVGVAAKAGKLGKVAKGAKQLENAEDVVSASNKAENIVKNSDIKAPDTDGVKIECPLVIAAMAEKAAKEAAEKTAKEMAEKEVKEATKEIVKKTKKTSIISPEMEEKILEGQRVIKDNGSPSNKVIGGHSSTINNNNSKYAVEILQENEDGTKVVKYIKEFPDNQISKIKKSTLFPENWSNRKIINSSQAIADTPAIGHRLSDGATIHREVIDGIEIEVIKVNSNVTSAYPTGGNSSGVPLGFEGIIN